MRKKLLSCIYLGGALGTHVVSERLDVLQAVGGVNALNGKGSTEDIGELRGRREEWG